MTYFCVGLTVLWALAVLVPYGRAVYRYWRRRR